MKRRELLGGLGSLAALGLSGTASSVEVGGDESAGNWPFGVPSL